MMYYKGTVVGLRQCGGCVEVNVAGESPGTFIIDNACFCMMVANEGTDWIGRPVEYEDAHMRFLDSLELVDYTASPDHTSRPALP